MHAKHAAAVLGSMVLLATMCAPSALAADNADTVTVRQLASTTLSSLTVTDTQADVPGYTQDSFTYWNKQPQLGKKATTADLIMVRDFDPVSVKATDGDVDEGVLKDDPYTGLDITYHRGDGSSIDIEHVVARSEAWDSGASSWSAEKRRQFANDPLELMAVSSSGNRAHGEKDAAGWLPSKGSSFGSNKDYDCKYVARQIAVKVKYGLTVDKAERDAMDTVLAACPAQTLPLDSDGLYWSDNTAPAITAMSPLASTKLYINGKRLIGFNYESTTQPAASGTYHAPRLELIGLPEGWNTRTETHEANGSNPPYTTLYVYDQSGHECATYTVSADPGFYHQTDSDIPVEDTDSTIPTGQPSISETTTDTPAPAGTTDTTPADTSGQARQQTATIDDTGQLASTGTSLETLLGAILILTVTGTAAFVTISQRKRA